MIYTVTLNPAVDRSVVINDFAPGKVNRILSSHDDPGGKGINVSKVIAELGAQSTAMGILGGHSGEFIEKSISDMGISVDFMHIPCETRTNIKISDPVNHATTDINAAGASLTKELTKQVLDKLLGVLKPRDIVVLAGKMDTMSVDIHSWITHINATGACVFLDTEGAALSEGVKASPKLIKPNEAELAMLLGTKQIEDTSSIIKAAAYIIKKCGVETVIVSRGSRGAVCVSGGTAIVADPIPVEEVCSTGAGDTMLGALACRIAQNIPLPEAFAYSVAAGTASVTCQGTQCPSKHMIDDFRKKVTVKYYEKI